MLQYTNKIHKYIYIYRYIKRIYIGIYVHKLCTICTLIKNNHVWTYVCIITCLNKTHCSQQLVVKFDHPEPIGFQTGIAHRVGEHQSFMWKVEEKVVANTLLIGSDMILCRVGFGWCHTTICAQPHPCDMAHVHILNTYSIYSLYNSTYLKYTSIMTPIWYCTWITIIYSEESFLCHFMSFLQGPTPQVIALHQNCPTGACVTINGEI